MTADFLGRLAASAVGRPASVRPVLRPLMAPSTGLADPAIPAFDGDTDIDIATPDPAFGHQRVPWPVDVAKSEEAAAGPDRSAPPTAPPEPTTGAATPADPAAPAVTPAFRHEPVVERRSAPERGDGRPPTPPTPPTPPNPAFGRGRVLWPVDVAESGAGTGVEGPGRGITVAAATPAFRHEPVAGRRSAPESNGREPANDRRPVVQVRIGRIEVHAAPPQERRPKAEPKRQPSAPNHDPIPLEAYLKGQREPGR